MRKITFLLMACLTAIMAIAEPANPTPICVTQPDGSTLHLKLVGDEFYHFNTTIDGYTVINVNGSWVYATKDGERLISSGMIAHDPSSRNAQELQLVASHEKHLVDITQTTQARNLRATRDKKNSQQKSPVIDYSQFRGLIILINYNDKQFQMSDPNNFYDQMCNAENYTGFYHEGQFQSCTGSVRDYFYDNSMGMFDPEFDVVGPINVDFSCLDGNDHSREIFQAAMAAVDNQVDFTQYDADNNGEIDMVFFMVAGYASSYSGNNSGYLWPHMSYLYGYNGSNYYYLYFDGKRMGRYASSCEIYGWESYGYTMPNAIGTVCHEFSHVMGLPDLYDTDYDGSGGESNHPGNWDVMAGGNHSNYGRTPTGYSLWERWEMGFASKPEELTVGAKSLTALNICNSGYMMSSPNDGEYFLFENRQANKWDSSLPGHGLVITRVERTNEQVWSNNNVNVDPIHNYYELVRASGTGEANVPFPGSSNVTSINSSTSPALCTWAGDPCQYGLSNIAENNKIITFNVDTDVIPTSIVEDFENMAVTTTPPDDDVQGVFTNWEFINSYVTNPSSAYCSGEHSAIFKKPSSLTMTKDVRYVSNKITFDAYNSSTTIAKFILYCSTDQGMTWTAVANSSGETTTSVVANSNATIRYQFDMNVPARYRISMSAGATTYKAYIDNFTIYYTEELPTEILGDANGDGTINVADYVATTSYILEMDPQPFVFEAADLDSNDEINVCDLVGVAYLALTYEGAPLVMPTLNLNSVANLSMDAQVKNNSSDTYDISINLSNDIDLTALQMDVTLPNGMTLAGAALSDRASASHQVTFSQLTNDDYRLVAASSACKAFKGNNGTVLTLTLNGDPSGAIILHGIQLSTPFMQGYKLDDIQLMAVPTSIENIFTNVNINAEGGNIIIESPNKGTAQLVLPNGKSHAVTVAAGRNVYHAPANGIIIVRINDIVKKVIVNK